MKQTDETKKTAAPADEAEAPEAETPLPDEALERVSGGGTVRPKNTETSDRYVGADVIVSDPHAGADGRVSDPHAGAIDDKEQGYHFPHI